MFTPEHWAKAFINSLEKVGGSVEEGIETLVVLASCVRTIPGNAAGRSAAEKLELLIRRAVAEMAEDAAPARETAVRFIILMVRKNTIRYVDLVIEKAKKLLDKKRGVVEAYAEYAFEPEEEFKSLLIDAIKKRTGAVRVELAWCLNPALIGGYRLRIGDEIIDVSVRSQLRELLAALQSGQMSLTNGGN